MMSSLIIDRPRIDSSGESMRGPVADYRAIARVSNSDLTRLKEACSAPGVGPGTKNLGRTFHQHLLEPATIGTVMQQLMPDLLPADTTKPHTLLQAVQQDSFFRRYRRLSELERVVLFTEPETNTACKTRLDMIYTSPKRQNALVVDLKPTAARTQAQFLQSCYDYEYDRQGAFYLDSLRYAEQGEWATTRQFRFVLIGVAQTPGRVFVVDATSIPGFIDYGRKKYRFWLRKWQAERKQSPQNTPTSWPIMAQAA